ncbi:hypothetical protein H5407_15215 [Mitsuaria sp. WAJ17]|uniref:hypothetical protein n=1 Tax=Mitsuaria sp. WAJ17 TaxID=2761452 RepID=UPI0015FFAFB9|nr:hypothetical protein [Mitsuaria sp. WAJ17]MBB2486574.1 hypothetical protein [Mitsuaria sp. WAJ17]
MKDTTRPGRRPLLRWPAMGLALSVAGTLWWLWPCEDEDRRGHAPPPAGPALRAAADPAARAASLPRPAQGDTPGLPAASPPQAQQPAAFRPADALPLPRDPGALSPEQLARIEQQWCTHGLKAHQQTRQALYRVYPLSKDGLSLDPEALHARTQAALKEPDAQAMLAVEFRLKKRWIEQLRQRGDMRSQAAADYLQLSMSAPDEARAASLHLLSLAQSSRDPMVFMTWQLARSDCLGDAHCSALPMTDWRTLDAGNLLAWLPTRGNGQNATDLDWDALARTRFANSYLEDFQALLLPLLDQEAPGLGLQQGLAVLTRLGTLWPASSSALALGRACVETGETLPARRAACLHAADLLWRSPSAGVIEYKLAVGMASLAGVTEQSPWSERLALVKGLSAADGQHLMELEYPSNRDNQDCETLAEQRRQLKERLRKGLWAAALGGDGARRIP